MPNSETLSFEELSPKAQKKAARDYLTGWLVTHPEEKNELTVDWAMEMALSDGTTRYLTNGSVASDL